jgi:hypothetical protein
VPVVGMGAETLHMWGMHGRVEIKSCRVAGQVREIINSTRSMLYPTLCAISWVLFSSRCSVVGFGAGVSQHGSLGGTRGRCF